MSVYYNDNDKFCAEWLRNLISEGLIPAGDVDDRDIRDVQPEDVAGYTQVHFFAGLGGWARALDLAGWPRTRPVWTASPPCQPFSHAGARRGHGDERHLWPSVSALIRERKPPVIFGEQVARAISFGWLDAVAADLEAQAYSFGAVVLPACAVRAPHVRNRIWFVAHADSERWRQCRRESEERAHAQRHLFNGCSADVVDTNGARQQHDCEGDARRRKPRAGPTEDRAARSPSPSIRSVGADEWWLTEPDVGRVAHGIPGRVGKLRALGNSIVPQLAATFIEAVM